jgi:hypothetical protein
MGRNYHRNLDPNPATADYSEAIRLDPKSSGAYNDANLESRASKNAYTALRAGIGDRIGPKAPGRQTAQSGGITTTTNPHGRRPVLPNRPNCCLSRRVKMKEIGGAMSRHSKHQLLALPAPAIFALRLTAIRRIKPAIAMHHATNGERRHRASGTPRSRAGQRPVQPVA